MKANKLINLTKAIALVGFAVAPSVWATSTYNDLILGFRASSGAGADTNLTVNLGNVAANYASGNTSLTLVGNINANLTSVYGADWSQRADVTFGVAGTSTDVTGPVTGRNRTNWVGKVNDAGATPVVWSQPIPSSQSGALRTEIAALYNGFNAYAADDASVALIPTSNSNSWNTRAITMSIGTAFSVAANALPLADFEQSAQFDTVTGSLYQVIDLWQFYGGTDLPTYVGTFGLTADGDIYFSNNYANFAAVPEPATWAIIVGAAALGLVGYRRFRRHPLAGIA
ncbi:hypothetical protein OPIT5_20275 [Opitutaceae bacterium TAV5]|nr:hypothetical protein OPIT5_20275 [Opitutaceae bacterium TAV5]